MKNRKIVLLLISITAIITTIVLYSSSKIKESFDNNKDVLIVISRYNEELNWLKYIPFNKYPVLIYNKGNNPDFFKPPNLKGIRTIDNVGRCDHTYLYHIIQNYDKLNDITVFLPGSNDMKEKMEKSLRLLNLIEENDSAVFIATKFKNVKHDLYSFQLNDWESSYGNNKILTKNDKLEPSPIRPFGKWFEDKFKNLNITNVSLLGIFSVSKEDILQHPKSYYEYLIEYDLLVLL